MLNRALKTIGLALFFFSFAAALIIQGPEARSTIPPIIYYGSPFALLFKLNSESPAPLAIYYGSFVLLIAANLGLLYALVTKRPEFGKLALGYCGFMWLLGNYILMHDAVTNFLGMKQDSNNPSAIGPFGLTGVEAVFWNNVWWLLWFFYFHAMFFRSALNNNK